MLDRIIDGRTDLVFDFVSGGHAATSTDRDGVRLIQWCAYYGDVSALRFLLLNGETLDSLGENIGLNSAAFHGHWQLCQFLIESGSDVDRPLNETGETPLHLALCKANRPVYDLVAKVLLANGANPNSVTKPGVPTDAFMRDSRTKAETPLHRAAAFGGEEVVRLLLDGGGSADAKDMNGDTPLTWASWHLRPDAILKALCYGELSIHPARNATADHGMGWGAMELSLLGKPHLERRSN